MASNAIPQTLPHFERYDARDLVLLYDELFEEDRDQIYAKMAADLEEILGGEFSPDVVRFHLCKVRRYLVKKASEGKLRQVSKEMAITVPLLKRIVATHDICKPTSRMKGRSLRSECRRLVSSGIVDNQELRRKLIQWAEVRNKSPNVNTIDATVSAVRKEFGLTSGDNWRHWKQRDALRIAA